MNAIVERYDRDAAEYARYWAPVLEATAPRALEGLDDMVAEMAGRPTILDVGTGTGSVAIAAARRWPEAQIIASDAARGMLEVARNRVAEAGLARPERLTFREGAADQLPLGDGAVDVVLSAFVLQLVPDRPAALREAHRLLRPNGVLSYVTWLDRESREPFRPMEEFDEAVFDLEIDEPDEPSGTHAGDVSSAAAAASELRRAGFRRATAREDVLSYDWTPKAYLEYKLAYDERALLSMLSPADQGRLAENARRRLNRLDAGDFRWRPPIVFARARRPA